MTTSIGLHIRQSLLGGLITSEQLNTMLTEDIYISGFLSLLGTNSHLKMILDKADALNIILGSAKANELFFNTGNAVNELTDNELAVSLMMKSSLGLVEFVDSQTALNIVNSSSSKRALINQFVNQEGYKLKRQTFTSNGTFTYSDTLISLSILLVGAGGNGSNVSVAGQLGKGGGGGEIVNVTQNSSFLSSGATIVIGTGANTTINTSTFVANKGETGENDPATTGTGGGTNSGDNPILYLPNVIKTDDILNNFWNYGNYHVKGGDGGSDTKNGYSARSTTENPYSSKFGDGGIYTNSTTSPTGGTGLGSGGAGGTYAGGTGSGTGGAGLGYGCGGGASNTATAGGSGKAGLVQFTYIIE